MIPIVAGLLDTRAFSSLNEILMLQRALKNFMPKQILSAGLVHQALAR